MSPDNRKLIQEAVSKAGDELKGRLPVTLEHPERNSYAHVWRTIKDKYGKSYKDCDDSQVDEIIALIEQVRITR